MNMEVAQKNFMDHSKEIACRFLQTVVTIDDNLIMSSISHNNAEKLAEPDGEIGTLDSDESTSTLSEHNLDYQTLSLEFAKKGIVCSGLTPRSTDKLAERISYLTEVLKNADLSIIDWEIGDKGELAKEVIAEIAHYDFHSGGQLRLICIFTGSNDLDILEQVAAKIREKSLSANVNDRYIDVSKDEERSYWRVVVISKNSSNKDSIEQDLPGILIEEFSKITAGLLSNAMLSSIGEIRNSTHKLLARFNSGLDSAYISHLIGLISLEQAREQAHQNAFDYAAELIAEQLKSEIQVSQLLKKTLSKEMIGLWPEWKNPKNVEHFFEIKVFDEEIKKIDNIVVKNILTFSTSEEALGIFQKNLSLSNKNISKFEKFPVEFKCNNEGDDMYVELSALEVCRRDLHPRSNPDDFLPVLKQGSILKDTNFEKFYICLQPLCDSVRLTENTFFLFIEVFKSDKFTQAIRTQDGYLKLKLDSKTSYLRSFAFQPCTNARVILGDKFNSQYTFVASHNNIDFNVQFEWIGELKNSVAQSLAANLTGQLGRIGLDTFEWLRLRK